MKEFLPQLKKLSPITAASKTSKSVMAKEIFFMIKQGNNEAYIIPVDKKLKPVDADFHYFSGDTAQLLRSLNSIKEDMAFQISWDDNDTEDVSLNQNPHLLYQVIRCKNLIDEKGNTITVHPETTVNKVKENNNSNNGTVFLSDSFALYGSIIYPIASIGDNYQQLSYFLTPFNEDMLEQYLSVFYSFIENVQVVYEDYTVEFSENDIIPTPSLSFEKIDAEKIVGCRETA